MSSSHPVANHRYGRFRDDRPGEPKIDLGVIGGSRVGIRPAATADDVLPRMLRGQIDGSGFVCGGVFPGIAGVIRVGRVVLEVAAGVQRPAAGIGARIEQRLRGLIGPAVGVKHTIDCWLVEDHCEVAAPFVSLYSEESLPDVVTTRVEAVGTAPQVAGEPGVSVLFTVNVPELFASQS